MRIEWDISTENRLTGNYMFWKLIRGINIAFRFFPVQNDCNTVFYAWGTGIIINHLSNNFK